MDKVGARSLDKGLEKGRGLLTSPFFSISYAQLQSLGLITGAHEQ
jgi:hypothetical protein